LAHGPPRELESDTEPPAALPPNLATKLDAALSQMDRYDAGFRAAREEERQAQLAKEWTKRSKEIMEDFREITRVLHQHHQVSLDVGADGGGRATRPFVEETGQKFERLYLTLEEGGTVLATSGQMTLARSPIGELTFEQLQKLVVVWVVKSIDQHTRGG